MDGGGCCSVGNKLPGASAAVSTNFANCLIFFGQKNRGAAKKKMPSVLKFSAEGE
jgi:hypothetical protein